MAKADACIYMDMMTMQAHRTPVSCADGIEVNGRMARECGRPRGTDGETTRNSSSSLTVLI